MQSRRGERGRRRREHLLHGVQPWEDEIRFVRLSRRVPKRTRESGNADLAGSEGTTRICGELSWAIKPNETAGTRGAPYLRESFRENRQVATSRSRLFHSLRNLFEMQRGRRGDVGRETGGAASFDSGLDSGLDSGPISIATRNR